MASGVIGDIVSTAQRSYTANSKLLGRRLKDMTRDQLQEAVRTLHQEAATGWYSEGSLAHYAELKARLDS